MMKSANALAKHGRNGDDVVVHMSKAEVDALSKIQGGKSINPKTGMPEFFSLGSALGIGSSLLGGALGAIGSDKASGKLAKGYGAAQKTYGDVFSQQKDALQPYQQFGGDALSRLSSIYGFGPGGSGQMDYSQMFNSPDFQVAAQQGQRQLDYGAASRGRVFSGDNIKDTIRFGQDNATKYFNNYLNRLGGFVGVGQQATGNFLNASDAYGDRMGAAQIGKGAARAAGSLGRYNALSGALENSANALGGMFGGP